MNDLVSFNRAALSDRWIFQTKPASCGGVLSINEGPLQAHAFLPRPERGRISPSAINKRTLWCGLYERTGGRLMEGLHLSVPRRCLASPTIAWPITHLAFDWKAAAERVLVITMEKSHLSLPWQFFLLLSSTGKQSWQINRIQAGSLFLGYSNCCLKHKLN